MPTYDLRFESWIPWRRRSGEIEWGPPETLLDGVSGPNPVVSLAAPRADFDGALIEFLIGLYAAALAPEDEDDWQALWLSPPEITNLHDRLRQLPPAFNLVAEEGPLFLQDFSEADLDGQDVLPIERLLIDAPGEQTLKLNKMHFVRADRFESLGLPAAAMALLTMQTYAPSGGAGNRTSMRGGGPLTTLADPRGESDGMPAHLQPLWQKLWMNVPTIDDLAIMASPTSLARLSAPELTYPWMAATNVSTTGHSPVLPSDAHPLQAFFGMPRRIRLVSDGPSVCALTGEQVEHTITGFRMRNYGVNYESWIHPLSPHYQQTIGGMWLPLHGQPGGLGWRDWPHLTLYQSAASRQPAQAVRWAQTRAQAITQPQLRLHAFGYDLDNMKARGWVDAVQPMYALPARAMERLHAAVVQTVDATDLVASQVARAVKRVQFGDDKDVGGNWDWVRQSLFERTEQQLFQRVRDCIDDAVSEQAISTLQEASLKSISSHAQAIFDSRCTTAGANVTVLRRLVMERHSLLSLLRGYTKLGEKLFTLLDRPLPGGGSAARKQNKSASRSPTNRSGKPQRQEREGKHE